MKLATYKDGSRDGQLLVVSRDLQTAHYATGIASRLQQVLDDWNFLSPQLQDLYESLNASRARHAFAFDPRQCMAPLPRAYQWLEGDAYGARGTSGLEPVMRQRGADDFMGPRDDISGLREEWNIDFQAGLAVVTGDVPRGCAPESALDSVRLIVLLNDLSLQSFVASEVGADAESLRARPGASCGPVAVTPDELGAGWRAGQLQLSLQCTWNGRKFGVCETGEGMKFHFGDLIAHAASTRRLRAGAIIGSGLVSPEGSDSDGNAAGSYGFSCIAQKRATEMTQDGAARTSFMKDGDTVRIEAKGQGGQTMFGAIEQEVRLTA